MTTIECGLNDEIALSIEKIKKSGSNADTTVAVVFGKADIPWGIRHHMREAGLIR